MLHFINPLYAKEPLRLASMCLAHNIPFDIAEMCNGFIICYPCQGEECVSDAICHDGSYGRHEGLLEIMGLVNEEEVGDAVEGYLTAEQVFERWHRHWLENHSEEGANQRPFSFAVPRSPAAARFMQSAQVHVFFSAKLCYI